MRPSSAVLAVLLTFLAPLAMDARQDAPRSPRNASYRIVATLNPVNHNILASGRLTWRNTAHVPATVLRFHTYWNAWRDGLSTWTRERRLAATMPLPARTEEDLGSIDVTKLTLVGATGQDLLARATFIAPDDGNATDQTLLNVPLDQPVAPGQTIDIDIAWNAHVPRTFRRTGVLGRYFFIAQWFPKIGVFEDAGWNAHQFHYSTEFFADYGSYDVQLTVPDGWIIGATGREVSSAPNGSGLTSHRFVEDDVHDFAWTTSPDFVEVHQPFAEPGLPAVDMRLLLQPEHRDQASRHFTAATAALKWYGTWLGPYPYGHLTIIDPVTTTNPTAQGNSTGGMEYPTLITAGTRWLMPWRDSAPEDVTIHEIGHQFLYGIVGTNEVEHAWMDEGLNTYLTARVMDTFPWRFQAVERYFGGIVAWPYPDAWWRRQIDGDRSDGYRLNGTWDPTAAPSWRYWPRTAGSVTYNKTALWLETLERRIGWDTMQRVLATYYARGAYRHPAPDEFFAIASEVSGQDLTPFFDAVYRSAATFDYGVVQVTSQAADNGSHDSTVVVRRFADGVLPVDVRVTFSDGSNVTERWDGRDGWHAFRYRRGASVTTVEVDPDRTLLLDVNYTNNSWSAHPRAADAAYKWTLRWLTWAENVLLTYGFFA